MVQKNTDKTEKTDIIKDYYENCKKAASCALGIASVSVIAGLETVIVFISYFLFRRCIPSADMSVYFSDPDLALHCRDRCLPVCFLHEKAKRICGIYERKAGVFFL